MLKHALKSTPLSTTKQHKCWSVIWSTKFESACGTQHFVPAEHWSGRCDKPTLAQLPTPLVGSSRWPAWKVPLPQSHVLRRCRTSSWTVGSSPRMPETEERETGIRIRFVQDRKGKYESRKWEGESLLGQHKWNTDLKCWLKLSGDLFCHPRWNWAPLRWHSPNELKS